MENENSIISEPIQNEVEPAPDQSAPAPEETPEPEKKYLSERIKKELYLFSHFCHIDTDSALCFQRL